MDASDLIRALPRAPCEEGAVHIWKAVICSSRLRVAIALPAAVGRPNEDRKPLPGSVGTGFCCEIQHFCS